MIIKKFQGKTEEEAIEKAKAEMGSNAIVMNMKTMKSGGFLGLFRKRYCEVTAALEEVSEAAAVIKQVEKIRKESEEQEKNGATEVQKDNQTEALEEKLDSLQSLLLKQLNQEGEEKAGNKEPEKEKKEDVSKTDKEESSSLVKLIYSQLLENEVDEKYANQIIAEIEKSVKKDAGVDQTLSNVYQRLVLKLGQPKCIEWKDQGQKVVFFIGPTGVGKTTTIAKIASELLLKQKAKVALLTADTYRIAATEQLKTYANILNVPFEVVYSPEDLKTAVNKLSDYDVILVDTSGHSSKNEEQMKATKALIASVEKQESVCTYLVLSATTKYRDLIGIVDAYSEMQGYRLIFTKADETSCLGNILNVKLYTGAELSYITDGQNVPDDIEKLNPQRVVKQLLGGN